MEPGARLRCPRTFGTQPRHSSLPTSLVDKLEPGRLDLAPDGTPLSPLGANTEDARNVSLDGNALPQRWRGRERFVILQTDFGLGLNFLTLWQAWRDDPQRCGRLHVVSFAKHPYPATDLAIAQRAWPEYAALAPALQQQWPVLTPGMHRLRFNGGQVILTLVFGNPASQLRAIEASVDAYILDDFSSDENAELCRSLSRLAAPGATLASPAVSEPVRAALIAAEFDLAQRPAHGSDTPILVGRLRSRRPVRHTPPVDRSAIVIGAGIAGSTSAHALAAAGWQVTVLEQASGPATGASCNLAGVLRPLPSADDNRLSRLTRAGYLATRALLAQLPGARWATCGVIHLGREPIHEEQQRRAIEQLGFPAELMQFVEADEASRRIGWPVDTGGWWFPNGGWVQPSSVCRAALAAFPERIRVRYGTPVARLQKCEAGWQALNSDGTQLAEAAVVVMASGAAAPHFEQFTWLPQRTARGQVTHLPANATRPLKHVICKLGYAMPDVDGLRLLGATLQYADPDPSVRMADHQENLTRLNLGLPGFVADVDSSTLSGRVGFRPMSPDRLPIVGPVPDPTAATPNTRLHNLPRQPGLWCVQGYGARGIVWSALMADLLVSRLEGEPLPVENDLVDACDPGRFLLKEARRFSDESDDTP
ncbi:MAG: bifunctional tRNA (5-methylaminomethyl-2-thiouridine)(34)-methyltransferase MnmD/FAD-dependent 5-carboxymethylaminomethyl-2-thiouridine(34) oxidoreductase MnmC [Betaproteobacteria bacterium]|nr:bifunctional tRNA (5-methylaminomethyl-2-thiouridine)(34)-methyltransferase MnmD/FAD-dependent 5-carboxymethylaminomethyl-2-thiouridine(34) oxidoreductase MnmC [Betaproteobacteria bacterium]